MTIHSSNWSRRWLTTYKGIPVTDPSLTLLTLGAVAKIENLELALEDVLRRSASSLKRIRELVNGEGRNKPGCKNLRILLDERKPGAKPTESGLETHLWIFLRRFNLPFPVKQFKIYERGLFLARADFAYPAEKVVLEGISWRYHSGQAASDDDRKRKDALRAAGWIVIEISKRDLRVRPEEVAAKIEAALASRQ